MYLLSTNSFSKLIPHMWNNLEVAMSKELSSQCEMKDKPGKRLQDMGKLTGSRSTLEMHILVIQIDTFMTPENV